MRFYERQGLIDDPPRTGSGYRQYSEDVISRLRFIKCVKGLGFSVKELAATCRESGSVRECSILETLYAEEEK